MSGQQFLSPHRHRCVFVDDADISMIPESSSHPSLVLHTAAIHGFSHRHLPRGPRGWSEAAFDVSRAFLSEDFPFCCYIVLPCKNEPTLDVDFGSFVVWGCHLATVVTGSLWTWVADSSSGGEMVCTVHKRAPLPQWS